MGSNYKRLGDYIQEVNIRNKALIEAPLMGVSIKKVLMPSIANIIGTDMSTYKLIQKNQFAYGSVTSRNGDKISIALMEEHDQGMVSQAYTVFEVKDVKELAPEYLMMWFRRPEFDRYARFMSHGSAREIFSWTEMRDTLLPIPSPEKQLQIIKEYNTIQNRIQLNNQLITKLEETAQAIYKQWFVDFEFPDVDGKPYKSNGGAMVFCEELEREIPVGWVIGKLNDFSKIVMGQSPLGESYNEFGDGVALVNGPVEFGSYFTVKTKWTTEPKKYCEKNDLILCVRGSTVGKIVVSDDKYAIGRGVCAIKSKYPFFNLLMIKNNLNLILKDVTGSTFPNLDRKTLEEFRVIIGSNELLQYFETKLEPLNGTIKLLHTEIVKIEELKGLLLARMTKVERGIETVEN
ncbi:restriction endonuclease subunit S [Flavobacterium frigoris]|uniref:Type I restriction enzyme, S subunit n=1 Tax=Flavobacterium frigoris TaxID=229204 RepID=A0A1H9LYW2_FLAFI|nr:restriction endonuclease subunit S [Flavobacterium frigoris]SER16628.1 type I restriction enzyme, S subunit [Flavobacterium frigoris]